MAADRSFEIVVVGAGAAGAAAALALARDGFRTCLIGPPETRADGRTVALLDGSVRLFRALGVWPALERRAAPMATMRLVDDTGSLFRPPPVEFHAAEIGLDAFGWNIENIALVEALLEAPGPENLTLIDKKAVKIEREQHVADITLETGSSVSARLLVAADGRNSLLRAQAAIRTRTWSYPQTALTAILTHDRDHRDASTEFHTREGPFTLVPLQGRRSSLVWVMSPERAQTMAALANDEFALAVERQAYSMLGRMKVAGPRGAFPMRGLSVERYHAERLALVGEAAHVFPPIGAQGLNLGLRDAASLRDAVVDAREAGKDIGSAAALAQYQRSRDLDVRLRTAAVDGLNRTLLAGLLPVDLLRGAGLLALSAIGPLRRTVMREGVLPRISAPRLMREENPSPEGRVASGAKPGGARGADAGDNGSHPLALRAGTLPSGEG
jgi:2-octaprenyl-6-methoxyphenol hydroxylase